MDTKYLEYLIKLEEVGNMTQAAAALYISQPNLSQYLANEERRIGQKLFRREGRRYLPTPAGQLYLEYARNMLALTEEFNHKLQSLAEPTSLRIGISSTRALEALNILLPKFRLEHPQLQISILNCTNLDNCIYALQNRKLDIAIITSYEPRLYPGAQTVLAEEEILFAAPASLPITALFREQKSPALTPEQLLRHFGSCPFILQHKGSCIRYLIDKFCESADLNFNVACYATDVGAITDMILNRVGVGFIPAKNRIASDEIVYFELRPTIRRTHCILFSDTQKTSPSIQTLVHLCQRYYQNIFQPTPG